MSGGGAGSPARVGGHVSWESFRAGIPGLSNPGRVKKLTQFFGDEPPLVRIFLRKLGYEVRWRKRLQGGEKDEWVEKQGEREESMG